MVSIQLEKRNIRDSRVLAAFRRVPRHEFVPDHLRDQAYSDGPLPL
ncbi:MAG: protein-L-isoaspartate(D-aspartate) O-methyltransferase, partial [Acidobacteriota bacterium]